MSPILRGKKTNLIKSLQFWDANATTQVGRSATTSIVNHSGVLSQSECNMSGLIIYHWMPGVHTHSPSTGSLCYMGLECLTTMSGGDQESNEHIFWIQTLSIPILRRKTVHSPHTFSMYYLYYWVSLKYGVRMSACLHVSCSEHFSKKISREDFIRRKTPDGPMTPAGELILTRYLFQLLISVRIATPHDWISNPRSIFLEWMFFP